MLPIIFNDNPSRLIELAMTGAVGVGGQNYPLDTKVVQHLLNAVPGGQGGPETKLAADGLVGPKTVAAIKRYQKANTRVSDGRVDVGGPTIRSLITWLNSRSLLPKGLPNLGPAKPEWARYLTGKAAAIPQPRRESYQKAGPLQAAAGVKGKALPVSAGGSLLPGLYTGWDFATSSGASVSVVFSAAVINIFLTHDTEPSSVQYRLTFTAIGTGLSALPLGLDFSTTNMSSYGTSIYYGANASAKRRPFNVNAFDLLPTWAISVGANFLNGQGWGGVYVAYGCVIPVLDDPQYTGALTGAQWGTPNAGITLYAGVIAGWA